MSVKDKVTIIISIIAIIINFLTILVNFGFFDWIGCTIQNWQINKFNKKIEKEKDTKN